MGAGKFRLKVQLVLRGKGIMAYCINWRDCQVCDSEMRTSHLVGYEAHPDGGFYERRCDRGEFGKKADENSTETEDDHAEISTNEQGM